MSESPAVKERVRASKLRTRKRDGLPVRPADEAWLATYEGARAKKTLQATRLLAAAPSNGNKQQTNVRAHRTTPIEARIDPSATTWTPKVPARAKDAEPIPEGMPQPPPAGTPLVDEPAVGAAGDPAAAAQLAQFVVFIVSMGIGAGRELAADLELPEAVKMFVGSDELAQQTLGTVHAAAERLAMKYGVRSVPMGDELVVAGALVGSALLVVRNMKRKKLGANGESQPVTVEQHNEEPKAPKSALDGLWGNGAWS